jgi:hypothetical protein
VDANGYLQSVYGYASIGVDSAYLSATDSVAGATFSKNGAPASGTFAASGPAVIRLSSALATAASWNS